jgi:hypothetical protein
MKAVPANDVHRLTLVRMPDIIELRYWVGGHWLYLEAALTAEGQS